MTFSSALPGSPESGTVQEISQAIEHLKCARPNTARSRFADASENSAGRCRLLKAAEPAFEFWNNPENAIYDEL
jgi:hypothetical protein